ncbi:reverse transcriptase family protein [Isosphaeraceae bacterium EP7]
MLLIDPRKPDKVRVVLDVFGLRKQLLGSLYKRLFLKRLTPSVFSHGGVRGRSIVSNANAHRASVHVYKADISDFFPTIHRQKVYDTIVGKFGCSPDVASICTRLCTHNHHLALGLTTSPILADQIMSRVDERIGAACKKEGLVYTRFVDDMTISGSFDLEQSGFINLIAKIVKQDGFEINASKNTFGRLSDGLSITSLRIRKGRLDVRSEYCDEVERQIRDARSLIDTTENFEGPYFTPTQIFGRVQFVSTINRGRGYRLLRQYRSVDWSRVVEAAALAGLVVCRIHLVPRNSGSQPIPPGENLPEIQEKLQKEFDG